MLQRGMIFINVTNNFKTVCSFGDTVKQQSKIKNSLFCQAFSETAHGAKAQPRLSTATKLNSSEKWNGILWYDLKSYYVMQN